MTIVLRECAIPEIAVPEALPQIPPATYARRCDEALARSRCDWLVVYADREHNFNIAFLCGYEPRFEEALLLLGPNRKRVLVVGNEGEGYTGAAGLPGLDIALCQTMSLMGQDRSKRPSLLAVLKDAGIARGQRVGVAGWKYLEPAEAEGAEGALFVPEMLAAILARLAGGREALAEATPVLTHPATGLRAIADADQIALHEWGAARSSAAVWRILAAARAGRTELEVAVAMGYAGEPLTAHVMLASGDRQSPVVGLRSPGARQLKRGDGVTTAIGYWGGLSCRAGLLTDGDDSFLAAAKAYFEGLIAWYETAEIGVEGGAIFEAVNAALARGGLRSMLNPGHLTGHDEWVHTPIRPKSVERIAAGMPFQVDIIPVPLAPGWTLNCEDGVAIADAGLRAELKSKHPGVWGRIEARRTFARDKLGLALRESILPLSNTPLCLAPFWLAPGRLLARA